MFAIKKANCLESWWMFRKTIQCSNLPFQRNPRHFAKDSQMKLWRVRKPIWQICLEIGAFDYQKCVEQFLWKLGFLAPWLSLLDHRRLDATKKICHLWRLNDFAGNQSLSLSRGSLFPRPALWKLAGEKELGINCLIWWTISCRVQSNESRNVCVKKKSCTDVPRLCG